MRVTQKDIAVRLGVTKVTVSLALRNSLRVSQETREKVRRVAEEMGYEPDPFLTRLTSYRHARVENRPHAAIGWLNHWPDPGALRGYHEFEQYWRGARRAAARMGYRLVECIWPAKCPAGEMERQLRKQELLGLLIPPHPSEVDWVDFDWRCFSLMRFGLSVRPVDSSLVTADHQRAMVMAIRKMRDYGYRRIGLVFGRAHDRSMGGSYFGGFVYAHKMLNAEVIIPPLDSDEHKPEATRKRELQAWIRKHRPDAILTAVSKIPDFLRELGYGIPRDVAVASTSPYDISVDAGIDQCPGAIGEIGAEMLIKQISLHERGEPADPCRILVESRWKDGKSLPPKPA
jgi:LacI family transcriptional regulator